MLVFNTDAVILRMRQLLQAADLPELAQKLGTSERALREWEEKNAIPLADLLSVANHADVTLDWLIYGREPAELSVDEEIILTTYRKLPKLQKIDAINYMSRLEGSAQNSVSQSAGANGSNNYIQGNVTINH